MTDTWGACNEEITLQTEKTVRSKTQRQKTAGCVCKAVWLGQIIGYRVGGAGMGMEVVGAFAWFSPPLSPWPAARAGWAQGG